MGNGTLDLSKEDVIQGLIAQWKDTFCTEAVYTPASKNPASFTGEDSPCNSRLSIVCKSMACWSMCICDMHKSVVAWGKILMRLTSAGPGFSVSLSGGVCSFDDQLFSSGSGEIEIDCVGPSVTVRKTPATFVSKSNDPETFISSVSTHCPGLLVWATLHFCSDAHLTVLVQQPRSYSTLAPHATILKLWHCLQYCSISSVLEDKLEDVFAKNITFSKNKDTSTTTEVLYVFDKKLDDVLSIANLTAQATSASNSTASDLDSGSITDLVQSAFMSALGLVNNPVSAVSSFVTNLGSDAQSAISNITSSSGPEVNTLLQVLAGK